MKIKSRFIPIFISLFFGLSSFLTACSSKLAAPSIAHTWHRVNGKNTMTFYEDGTTRNVDSHSHCTDILKYKIQEDGALVLVMDWGGDVYFDKTSSAFEAMDDWKLYYLQDDVLIYATEVYYIEDNKSSQKKAEDLYSTTFTELKNIDFIKYFSKNYKVIENLVDSEDYDAGDKMFSMWQSFEEFLKNAPKETTYYKEKTFEPISLSEAIGTRCYVWNPKYREVAIGEIQKNGEISGEDCAGFDYIVNDDKDRFGIHLNYGSFKDGMLNGKGTSYRCDFRDGELYSDRLMIGNFINNRPDGKIEVVINMSATNEKTTQIELSNGTPKTFGLNEDGRVILGYFKEDKKEYTWPADDANDIYVTYYDRLTNKTYH